MRQATKQLSLRLFVTENVCPLTRRAGRAEDDVLFPHNHKEYFYEKNLTVTGNDQHPGFC